MKENKDSAIDWKRHKARQLIEYISQEDLINYILECEEYRTRLINLDEILTESYSDLTEKVKYYENTYRNTPDESFYKLSHLKTIQKLNAKREQILYTLNFIRNGEK